MQWTTAPDGEQLAYQVEGPPGTPAILTVHGLVSSFEHWPFFDAHYRRTHRVVGWEFRGHGGRPMPALATISVEQFADDAYAVWRAASIPPAITVGLSFGVQVALEQWRRHPDSIRALVLICGTAGHPLDRVSSASALRRGATGLVRGLSARPLAWPLLAALRSRPGSWLARQAAFVSGGAHRGSCPREVLDALFTHVASLPPAHRSVPRDYLDAVAHAGATARSSSACRASTYGVRGCQARHVSAARRASVHASPGVTTASRCRHATSPINDTIGGDGWASCLDR